MWKPKINCSTASGVTCNSAKLLLVMQRQFVMPTNINLISTTRSNIASNDAKSIKISVSFKLQFHPKIKNIHFRFGAAFAIVISHKSKLIRNEGSCFVAIRRMSLSPNRLVAMPSGCLANVPNSLADGRLSNRSGILMNRNLCRVCVTVTSTNRLRRHHSMFIFDFIQIWRNEKLNAISKLRTSSADR